MKHLTKIGYTWFSFCVSLLLIRWLWSGWIMYYFLLWNLFLAYIPLFLSNRLHDWFAPEKTNPIVLWSLLACWLAFLPNAPYIITDLIHIKHRPPIPLWFDALLLFNFSVLGWGMGILSILQVYDRIMCTWKEWKSATGLILISLASGFGLYLRRIERLNSWDLITNPWLCVRTIKNCCENETVLLFSILFGVMMYLSILVVKQLKKLSTSIL